MTPDELVCIDSLIKRYDCKYLHFTSHPNVKIMHANLLLENLLGCPCDVPRITREDLLG